MNELALLLPPLAAGLLALASHVPLGRQVLRRGIVFIDLASRKVSHVPPAFLAKTAAMAG